MLMTNRLGRTLLTFGFALSCATRALAGQAEARSQSVKVYKTAACDCCSRWAEHLRRAGFGVDVEVVRSLAGVRKTHAVPLRLQSCHTAVVEGYVVEGHVPADVVQQLLRQRPPVIGVAVPGMPRGSPGMEGPTSEPYEVLTFDRDGRTTVFAKR